MEGFWNHLAIMLTWEGSEPIEGTELIIQKI